MAGDVNYSNVSLLLHCDGVNNSTTFADNSSTPKTVTANGLAKISTAQSKFGGASGVFSGSTSYLSVPYSSELSLVSGDFTIEAWIYLTTLTSSSQAILDKDGVEGASYPQYSLGVNSTGKIDCFLGNGNGVSPVGGSFVGITTITLNAWHHVAIVRTGSTCKGFLNGSQEWSGAAATMYEGSKPLLIGYSSGQPTAAFFNGHIDDLRITKGVARYTANFTPPTSAFANGLAQVSGIIRDNSGTPCARTVRLVRRDTGAPVGNTTSNASTGLYAIDVSTLDEVVRIVHSNTTTAPLENDLIDRVIPA